MLTLQHPPHIIFFLTFTINMDMLSCKQHLTEKMNGLTIGPYT